MLRSFLLCLFLFPALAAYTQPKSPEIKKTKSSAIIDGKKFYLHTVEKGQTLYAISKVYEISVSDILTENPEAVDGIRPGQVLRVPYTEKDKKKKDKENDANGQYYYHKVEQGETVYSIAKRFGLSEDALIKSNPEVEKEGLKTGQLLKLPGEPREIKPPTEIKNNGLQSLNVKADSSVKFNDFKVALFLPFYLSNIVYIEPGDIKKGTMEFPEKSRIAIEFYQGVLMALDSIKAAGINVHLNVYDTGKDSTGVVDLSQIPEMKTMDLIIGPLYTNNFSAMAKYAKENNIPIVTPFSQNNKILLGNAMVSKAVPSAITQLEQVSDFIAKKYKGQNIMLMASNNPKEAVYVNTVKQIINESGKEKNPADTALTVSSLKMISDNLKTDKINIIVIPNSNPSYITDMLSKLNKMKEEHNGRDSIIVFGMSSWSGIESIDFEYLNNLHVHIPANSYISYEDTRVKNFILRYRAQYMTEPSEYVYQGYDVTAFYIQALHAWGSKSLMDNISKKKWSGLHMNFDLYQASVDCGYENRGVYILRYDHYQLIRAE